MEENIECKKLFPHAPTDEVIVPIAIGTTTDAMKTDAGIRKN